MQYNVCIWALSDYKEQKDKKYAIGNKYIFIFFLCLLKLSPGIINLLRIKNIIFCIPCALCIFPDLTLAKYTVTHIPSNYLM